MEAADDERVPPRPRATRGPSLLLGLAGAALLPACDGGAAGDVPRDAASPASVAQATPPSEPTGADLVLVVVDTLRADHLRADDGVATPALDRLAADGIAFELAFAHVPLTLPAHTALFSSRHPYETGVLGNRDEVPDDLPLLAEWLGAHGYATGAAVGIGTLWKGTRIDRGFDEYTGPGWRFLRRADEMRRRVAPLLERLAEREPFFLFAHYSDPHAPYNAHGTAARSATVELDGNALAEATTSEMTFWEAERGLEAGVHELVVSSDDPFTVHRLRLRGPRGDLPHDVTRGRLRSRTEAFAARFELEEPTEVELLLWVSDAPGPGANRTRYALEVEYVDRAVGALLDELRARGLYDSSLIVFTADHGEGLGEHGHVGHVRHLYDEALHVPLLVKPPAGSPLVDDLRRARDRLARHVDVVPTILELLGLPPLPGQTGVSLRSAGAHPLFAETREPAAPASKVALRDERYELILNVDDDSFELYDVRADPGQLENLFAREPDARAEWVGTLRRLAALGEEGARSGDEELDDETRQRLEALGYLGTEGG